MATAKRIRWSVTDAGSFMAMKNDQDVKIAFVTVSVEVIWI
jgi:hypothetical protein